MAIFGNPRIDDKYVPLIGVDKSPSAKLREINKKWKSGELVKGLDPEFGYHTATSDYFIGIDNKHRATKYACPAAGTANSIGWYGQCSITGYWKASLYKASDLSLVAVTEEGAGVIGTTWFSADFAAPKPTLAAADYYLGLMGDSNASGRFYYAAGDTGQSKQQTTGLSYPTFPEPLIGSDLDWKFCIYCDYTLAVAPANPIICPPLISPDEISKAIVR